MICKSRFRKTRFSNFCFLLTFCVPGAFGGLGNLNCRAMKFFFTGALALCAFSAALAAPAPQTLPRATQLEIESLLRHPGLQNARVGVAVVALGEAKTPAQFPALPYDNGAQPLLFGRDETKRFTPASNFKLFTSTWALQTLGPKTTLETRVTAAPAKFVLSGAWPDSEAPPTVLTLTGGGDPSLESADIRALARQITDKIAGDDKGFFVVRAHSLAGDFLNAEFGGRRYPDGWTLDDAIWYYGPPVTGLAVNRNQVDVTLTGAAKAGEPAQFKSEPEAPFTILSNVVTVDKSDPRAGKINWDRGDADSPLGKTLRVRGFIGAGATTTEGIAVPDPAQWAAQILADEIVAAGGKIANVSNYTFENSVVVASHQSAPVGTLIRRFLKNSDNLYGEMLLRRAGATIANDAPLPPNSGASVSSDGVAAVAHRDMIRWLLANKVPVEGLRFSDGSGLSRYDTATPLAIARLLGVAQKLEGGDLFYDSLPIAGVDGTLKNRFVGSAAQGNLHGKTGTFSITNCLSGYVTTRDGQRLAVSILTNFVEDGELARRWQGRVMATLANASWVDKK